MHDAAATSNQPPICSMDPRPRPAPRRRNPRRLDVLAEARKSSSVSPTSRSLIAAVREVAGDETSRPQEVLTLLWLILTSEHCQRTLEAASPESGEIEALARRLGDPARAWVQFSPAACDLLYGEAPCEALRSPRSGAAWQYAEAQKR